MPNIQDWVMPAAFAASVIAGTVRHQLRPAQHTLPELARHLRDLLTLRMVLRGTKPSERAALLDAHRAWRTEPPPRPTTNVRRSRLGRRP
jgi:hypothetical protein